ncbi:hypothetical protein CK486_07615 [Pseudomonas sp. HAR-UPW-AIA-41]|nr:hypothetical protein CK486_07615 [Pseudomonas sp. HAR-UPW-AIA-41]
MTSRWVSCCCASPPSRLVKPLSSKTSDASPGPAAAGPASPCVRQCCLDAQDICLGCGRSLSEILEWGPADAARRHAICAAAQTRRQSRGVR